MRVATPDGARSVHRAAGSVSSFGGSPARQEIGLGDATAIEALIVQWPNGGARQVFENVALDRAVRVVEGEAVGARQQRGLGEHVRLAVGRDLEDGAATAVRDEHRALGVDGDADR